MSDKETTIYFYGADNPNGWLSQMFSSQFEYEGVTYSHNEQFFQAAKASYFGDQVGNHDTFFVRSADQT